MPWQNSPLIGFRVVCRHVSAATIVRGDGAAQFADMAFEFFTVHFFTPTDYGGILQQMCYMVKRKRNTSVASLLGSPPRLHRLALAAKPLLALCGVDADAVVGRCAGQVVDVPPQPVDVALDVAGRLKSPPYRDRGG